MRTDGVEPPQHEAPRLQRGELTGCSASAYVNGKGGRPGSNRRRRGSQPRVLPLHHGHHESGDDRTRTGGLSPDKRVLCTSELRPRRVRGWDSNPRSRAHEAREDSRSSTAQVWPAGVEPAISGARSRRGAQLPHSQKTIVKPPAGLEPAASGLRARRHRHFDHGGICCRATGGSATRIPPRKIPEAGRSRGRAWSHPGASSELRRQGSNLRSRG
jgi:hypothetical protein